MAADVVQASVVQQLAERVALAAKTTFDPYSSQQQRAEAFQVFANIRTGSAMALFRGMTLACAVSELNT